jgi:hypothetical protein
VITPIFYVVVVVAFAMGLALWLSAWDVLVPRGQAIYVLGLIALLAFAALEFQFFIGLVSRITGGTDHLEADDREEEPDKDDAGG